MDNSYVVSVQNAIFGIVFCRFKYLAILLILIAHSAFAAATVSDVQARQRYPWNGMVDIDYTISGDATGLKIEIGVEDRQNGKTYFPSKFMSSLPISEGRHRVTWSTAAEGVTIISTNVAVTVSLVKLGSDEGRKTDLYYVVDLANGPTATRYPVTTLETEPGSEWSVEYKTTKLVLRRIEAGVDPLKRYTITKPFYIGVFEVTAAQWNLVMSTSATPTATDARAKGSLNYDAIRGATLGSGWPNSADVDDTSFLGVLRKKTGLAFDLPTEAQWEYACRAGTTSKYNNGGDSEADLQTLGRYSGNRNDGRGGYSDVTTVGSYAPNDWGLYDMHGNVYEWCLDYTSLIYDSKEVPELSGCDPKGATNNLLNSVVRSSAYNRDANAATSSSRDSSPASWNYPSAGYGFRLACPAGL